MDDITLLQALAYCVYGFGQTLSIIGVLGIAWTFIMLGKVLRDD